MSKLDSLHRHVKELALQLMAECERQGQSIVVTQTLRTDQEQNDLYAQGRTKPGKVVTNAKAGQSIHNYGLAFDIACRDKDGKIQWNDEEPYKAVGAIGEGLGLEWGGNWKFRDLPHFQWTGGLTLAQLQAGERPKLDEST